MHFANFEGTFNNMASAGRPRTLDTSARVLQLDVVVEGSSLDMGTEQGVKLRERIRAGRDILANLEAFRLMQPSWMPYVIFKKLCELKASRALAEPLRRDFPEAAERLSGIAIGAGVDLRTIHLFTAIEAAMSERNDSTTVPALGGCSAIAVRRAMSASGEPIIARNFDYLSDVRPLYSIRKTLPSQGLRSLDFTMAPFAGTVDGVNENGLCITYNYAYTTDTEIASAPISIVVAEALQRCSTVREAIAWVHSRPRWGGGILMLADADGEIASLELSSTRAEARIARQGQDVLFHNNNFWTDSMREVQVPDTAVYSTKAPAVLRGRSLHESAMRRTSRLRTLLEVKEGLSIEAVGRIMSDHGDNNEPTDTTVCVHGPYWSTTASLQLFPRSRRIRVAFDSACSAQFVEFSL